MAIFKKSLEYLRESTLTFKHLRKNAITHTLEKNPTAFQPKITNSVVESTYEETSNAPRHKKVGFGFQFKHLDVWAGI